jgi:hypothetical protein
MSSYDRALHALRTWLDSSVGRGPVDVEVQSTQEVRRMTSCPSNKRGRVERWVTPTEPCSRPDEGDPHETHKSGHITVLGQLGRGAEAMNRTGTSWSFPPTRPGTRCTTH